jgi:peptide/nickel transport system substrate-binding protein
MLALLCLALCPEPAVADTVLRARLNADIVSTMPGMRRDENTDAVLIHVVEGLVATQEDGSVGPLLAKRWEVSADGKTYTFFLREGVPFHNGKILTAQDVLWSFRWYLNPANHWRCLAAFNGTLAKIESVTSPQPMTVRIVLDRPVPLFLKTLARNDCGGTGILQRASVAADGHSWIKPIGTGPFMLGEWAHGNYLELLRFSRYAALSTPPNGNTGNKRALVDRIRLMIIPDSSSAAAALVRGSLDVTDALDYDQMGMIEHVPGVRIAGAAAFDFYVVLLQTNDPVLKDRRIRRALALSIDRVGLAAAATNGTALADASPIPVKSPFYSKKVAGSLAPDLVAARRLLAASGYKGQPIILTANRRYPEQFAAAVMVQAMALRAGINIQIQLVDWATEVSLYSTGNYQALSFGFSAKADPTFNFDLLIGRKSADPRKVWDTDEARTLHAKAAQETTTEARQKAFANLNAAFLRDTPAIVLFNSIRITASRTNVYGLRPWPMAQQRLWNVGVRR